MSDSLKNRIGWVVFSCLHVINAFFHRMWGDELQAWSLITSSQDLPDLHMKLARDGHPALWYLLVWPFKYLESGPMALQIVSGLATICMLGLLWQRSPFSLLEKTLLSFSFQLGFNLSVVSRSYAIANLVVFLFVALLPHYRRHPWLAWGSLALMANIHIYCLLLSLCFALSLIRYAPAEERPIRGLPIYLIGFAYCVSTTAFQWRWFFKSAFPLVFFGLPLVLGFVIWLTSTRSVPAKVRRWLGPVLGWTGFFMVLLIFSRVTSQSPKELDDLLVSISALGRGILPIVNPFQYDYWHLSMPTSIGVALMLVATFAIGAYFRKEPFILSLLGLQASFMLFVFTHLLKGQTWHSGVLFLGVLGFVWMGRYYRLRLGPSWLLLIIFLPQALVGANAMMRSKVRPISNCYATAQWIRSQEIDPEHLMGYTLFPTLGVAAYLEEPIYFLETEKRVSYSTWRESMDFSTATDRIVERMRKLNLGKAYLVTPAGRNTRIEEAIDNDKRLRWTEVFRSSGALRGEFSVLEIELIGRPADLEESVD